MYVVLTVLAGVPLAIAVQMTVLYGTDGPELREQGERQARAVREIPAMRGSIRDANGRPLAVNTARYEVAVDPTIEGFDRRSDEFFDRLSEISARSAASLRRMVERRASTEYVQLLRDVSEETRDTLAALDVPGLILEPRFDRHYVYGRVGAHLLGHVDTDLRGLSGLELAYDEHLRGTPGRRAMRRNRYGLLRARVGGQITRPQHGQQLELTVDLVRQSILEDELAQGVRRTGAEAGLAVAMNPQTGAVLGMATMPRYDPNRPSAFAKARRRNRVVTDQFEPGSTFKLVTAIAAIEQGAIGLRDSLETGNGWTVFHGKTMQDVHAHGTITFAEAVVVSSNVGIAKTAMRLHPEVLYQYARNLGFGQRTGVGLPGEVDGLLKEPQRWSGTTQPWMSIGYEVQVTPIQLLTAYSALANGGRLMQPYVVARRSDMRGNTVWEAEPTMIRRAFERETARALKPVFQRVVEEGTATRAQVEGMRVAGKTGTAHKVVDGSYSSGARASFVGFFPVEEPRVALLVMLDEPSVSNYGGVAAAPIFRRIAERWVGTYPDLAGRIAARSSRSPGDSVTVPELTGRPVASAVRLLRTRGLTSEVSGPVDVARTVAVQRPAAGVRIPGGAEIRLDVAGSDSNGTVPDLRGLPSREAVRWARTRDLQITVRGDGIVTAQSPSPGRTAARSLVVEAD